jgi:pimeloyl-ACP methyl ester carboxylesterase
MNMPVAAGLHYFLYEGNSSNMPIVLIHGAGGSHLSWPPDIRRLAGYRVYAIDLPGHGKSDSHGEQTISAYAERVLEWMETLNLYRVFIVGHSMGGAVAMSLAVNVPARVTGLGLLGIGIPFDAPKNILEDLSNPVTVPVALNQLKSLSFAGDANPRIVELVSRRLFETRISVIQGDFIACARINIAEIAESINQPAILIVGAKDQIVPLRHAQLLGKKIKRAELAVVLNAGHMVMLEKSAEVTERLGTFLQKNEFLL